MSAEYDVGRYLHQTRGRFKVKARSWGFHLTANVRRPFRPGWLQRRRKPAWATPIIGPETIEAVQCMVDALRLTAERLETPSAREPTMSALTKSEREELEELRAILRADVCSPRLVAEIGLHEMERELAMIDLMIELTAMRRGVGVSYPTTLDPLDYNAEPMRRLWPTQPSDRAKTLEMIGHCKRAIEKHKGEPAKNPNRELPVERNSDA